MKDRIDGVLETQPVSGVVALDSATLAALENITVAVSSGEIALDSATLAALESIIVTGTVELGATTLAALETVNAVVSGEVSLDATTLAALENITATVSGTVTVNKGTGWVDPQTDALTNTELRATPLDVNATLDTTGLATDTGQNTGNGYLATLVDLLNNRYTSTKLSAVATLTTSGDTTIITPSAGNAIRMFWFSATQDADDSSAPLVKLSIGGTEYYRFFGAMAHSEQFEGGADETLVVNLSGSANYSVTVHYEEFTP